MTTHGTDLAELRHLLSLSTRPGVQFFLQQEITRLETIARAEAAAASAPPPPCSATHITSSAPASVTDAPATTSTANLPWREIPSYGYDQDDDFVSIFVSLTGVGALPPGHVTVDFTPTSFTLQVMGLGGANHRLVIPELHEAINPAKSRFLVRPSRVVVKLSKAASRHWSDLKPSRLGIKKPKLDDSNPTAGIMDLMKNMYSEGDDEMKRTIAKAWMESQEKKAKGDNTIGSGRKKARKDPFE
eukprot:gnl/Spiro4/22847_TR11267_c0_g1_i1.p1 gnl/Spiro4/22847_TR11267_c0_g1~~gnl/Spiro4/22847_TR11267_c0_g1_i1.p1  ORF type:complete len:259 (-),score=70.08 gnl/Spiro4/22847_TR11267_c0_g1_i1:163-894(-)